MLRPYQRARSHLRGVEGKDEVSIEAILEGDSIDEILREYRITPPAITTTGAWSMMKRLCEAAELNVLVPPEGPGDLQLHSARRGIGDTFYQMNQGAAQDLLRHQSLETTKDHYSHIDATKGAKRASEILDQSDDRS